MGFASDIITPEDWQAALAALAWQVDLGVTEAIGDAPVDRYALPDAQRDAAAAAAARPAARGAAPMPATPQSPAPVPAGPVPAGPDPVALARAAAGRAGDLAALEAAVAAFDLCELKRGARTTVFCDGTPKARVMIIGEAPGREEDIEGRPFVGAAGQLLDRMFAAIGLGRTEPDATRALYITNVMPWRPPQNRDPSTEEIAMMQPFLHRHVDLADPDVIVVMGNTSAQAVLGRKGILRLRGQWTEAWGRPALPMLHPAYLLRNPAAKREAWADLLALKAWLAGHP